MTRSRLSLATALLTLLLLAGCHKQRPRQKSEARPATAVATTASKPSHILALLQTLPSPSQGGDQAAEFDRRLAASMTKATNKERRLLRRFKSEVLPVLRKPNPTGAELEAGLKGLLELLRGLAALHPNDVDVQVVLAASLSMVGTSVRNLGLDGTTYRAESLRLSRALVTRFPRSAKAHAQLGHTLALQTSDHGLDAMKHYARCLELEPTSARCRETLQALATDHRRPRCAGRDIESTVVLQQASVRPSPGAQKTTTRDGQLLFLVGRPLFGASDIAYVIDHSCGAAIVLSPAATKRFATATESLARQPGAQVALVVGGKVLTAPRLLEAIPGGRLVVCTGEDRAPVLGQLCTRTSRPQLPPELEKVAGQAGRGSTAGSR